MKKIDGWIEIVKLMSEMPREEQIRCLAGTAAYFGVEASLVASLQACRSCGGAINPRDIPGAPCGPASEPTGGA